MARNIPVHHIAAEGYTLAELLIVVACIAIIGAAAVPNIVRLQKEWTLWGGARTVEAALQWGRMHAVSFNAPVLFRVDDSRQKFHWEDPESGAAFADSIRYLSGKIRIESCPRRPLRFYQHGNAAPAGTYVVKGDAGSYSVVVSPGGRIRIQRN
jgi:Tfp pilus assembly protein FimT